ncbi:DUF6783 domain-containing protein [uncultured Robinsoniella sp.]
MQMAGMNFQTRSSTSG